MPANKKPEEKADDTRKAFTYRATLARWKDISIARIEDGISAQALMDRAVDDYLAKRKLPKKKGA